MFGSSSGLSFPEYLVSVSVTARSTRILPARAHPDRHFASHVQVLLFVQLGKEILSVRIQFESFVPFPSCVSRATDCVHLPHQSFVACGDSVGANSGN